MKILIAEQAGQRIRQQRPGSMVHVVDCASRLPEIDPASMFGVELVTLTWPQLSYHLVYWFRRVLSKYRLKPRTCYMVLTPTPRTASHAILKGETPILWHIAQPE